MKLLLYSKALYSTWVYYGPDRTLFDAGEGASSVLGNKAFAVRRVFLSHGHADHIAGLVGLINIRNNAMGDKEKELTIYYPKGNYLVCEMMAFLAKTNRRLSYDLEWVPLVAGDRIQLLEGQMPRYIEAFPTVHVHSEASLGYSVLEVRHRLRPELAGKSEEEIAKIARSKGKDAVTESYEQRLFSYTGDCVSVKPAHVQGTEVLCHDVTFLDEADRKEFKHASLAEAIELARAAGVKKELLGIHISSRYKARLREIAAEVSPDLPFKLTLIPPGRIVAVE